MDMKKKGFTLIELLAVIVILAIIALILTPKISEIIMSARKAAFKETINGVLTSAQNYVTESILETENKDVTYPITFECDGTSCKNDKGDDLNFRGEVPISGEITILGTGVYADEVCNKYFCGSGYIHSISIVENDGNVPTNGIFEYNGTNGSDGSVQTYVVTKSGNYLLEAWGAQGGDSGGLGGYASGILKLKVNDILAVVVGGQGVTTGAGGNVGGYNGGGTGAYYGAGGGGATHIAIYNESYNTLTSYGDVDTATGLVYIIAGGGGGGSNRGGAGGGLVGQNGYGTDQWGNPNYSDFGYGGTQTAGGSNYSYNCGGSNVGAFGQGGSTCRDSWSSGGGGGYYGGGAAMSGIDGGGGGSGYVNSGINNWQLKTGVREGHGLAKITYIGSIVVF